MKKMILVCCILMFIVGNYSFTEAETEDCSCATAYSCSGYGHATHTTTYSDNPHTKTTTYSDPNTTSVIDSDVLADESTNSGSANSTCCPVKVTSSCSITINENKTLTAGAAATVGAKISAEASFVAAKAAVEGSWSFQVSGSYAVQTGSSITQSLSEEITLAPHTIRKYLVKKYKDVCDVSSSCTDTITCAKFYNSTWPFDNHGGTATDPSSGATYTENAGSYRYTYIIIDIQGTEPYGTCPDPDNCGA